jgi:hypothetical protein
MKTYIIPTILALFILAGCSSTKNTSAYDDDVYYSGKREKKEVRKMQSTDPDYYVQSETISEDQSMDDYEAGEYVSYEDEPVYSESETIENPDGTTYITNNYYGAGGYGDYYDYSYSARINRFYNPYMGFGYYSPCYVGFYYDPWYYPTWYGPSMYFGLSWGWGWGSMGWGYPYWGYPWYGYGYYGSYWQGYNHGYWDGYYAGQYWNDGYNSYYYGPRNSRRGGNSPATYSSSGTGNSGSGTATYAERNRPLLSSGVVSVPRTSGSVTGSRNEGATVVSKERSNQGVKPVATSPVRSDDKAVDAKPAGRNVSGAAATAGSRSALTADAQEQKQLTRPSAQEAKPRYNYKKPEAAPSTTGTRYRPGDVIDSRTRTQPQPRYTKPASYNAEKKVTRTTTRQNEQRSALYSKPRPSSGSTLSKPSQNNALYAQPSRSSTRSFSQPTRSNVNSYSSPSRSGSSYSRPASTGSSRSSYSRPSSSGFNRSSSGTSRSYSAPSRSSSGGGATRSSSGGSRGGRR